MTPSLPTHLRSTLRNLLLGSIILFIAAAGPSPLLAKSEPLVIMTYDSMMSSGGLGDKIFPLFSERCKCQVKPLVVDDAGRIVNQILIDSKRNKFAAHIALGIDQNLWPQVSEYAESWRGWLPKGYERIASELTLEPGFLPFDFSIYAFMVNDEALKNKKLAPPQKLRDLLKPEWKRHFVIQDPRTSSPGLAFLLHSENVLKGSTRDFWRSLKGQWLTMPAGWGASYNLFLEGEAPMVWSYTTSEAYHRKENQKQYRAVIFEDGQPLQIEGAMIIKGSTTPNSPLEKNARAFLDFLISKEVQTMIPNTQWMLPVRNDVELPPHFQNLPQPKKLMREKYSQREIEQQLKSWNEIVGLRSAK